jgi:tRNA 2-thiouridine synthesizing protein A
MSSGAPDWVRDRDYDAGEKGCGEVLMELRGIFRTLPPGTRVLVHTVDAGAPIEMPAWCRLTGRRLVESGHPYYLIEN